MLLALKNTEIGPCLALKLVKISVSGESFRCKNWQGFQLKIKSSVKRSLESVLSAKETTRFNLGERSESTDNEVICVIPTSRQFVFSIIVYSNSQILFGLSFYLAFYLFFAPPIPKCSSCTVETAFCWQKASSIFQSIHRTAVTVTT